MPDQLSPSPPPSGIVLKHVASREELAACFPMIGGLRSSLKEASEWTDRGSELDLTGYRVLAAWDGDRVSAVAGYRVIENLIHGRFLYVDDLVTADSQRGRGLGISLLNELSTIGLDNNCRRLILDAEAADAKACRFYLREGQIAPIVSFMKSLDEVA